MRLNSTVKLLKQMLIPILWIGGESMNLLTLLWLNLLKSICAFAHQAVHLKDFSFQHIWTCSIKEAYLVEAKQTINMLVFLTRNLQ